MKKKSMTIYVLVLFIASVVCIDVQVSSIDTRPERNQDCQAIPADLTPLCNISKYTTISPFSNTLKHRDLHEAVSELHRYIYLFLQEPCRSKIQLFLCSLYAPVCVRPNVVDRLLLPCRDDCEEARKVCSPIMINTTWPQEWNCSKFNYYKDDKLCVINNARASSVVDTTPLIDTRGGCNDLFDCHLTKPEMKYYCIDPSLVCNGVVDCIGDNETGGAGLDEVGCSNCSINQLQCDGKCIENSDRCNGKLDCSSGIDEQNCDEYVPGLVQSLVWSIALTVTLLGSIIYLCTRCFKVENTDKLAVDVDDDHMKKDISCPPPEPQLYPNEDLLAENPIYQEPTYSVMSRSIYERLAVGGCSGASSVYQTYSDTYNPLASLDDRKEPPAAPPPTPAPSTTPASQQVYSSDSDLYVVMNSPYNCYH